MTKHTLETVHDTYAFRDPEEYHKTASRWSIMPEGVGIDDKFTEEVYQKYLDLYKSDPDNWYTYKNNMVMPGIRLDDETAQRILDGLIAREELSQMVEEFEAALAKAEEHANKHNLEFNISPAYGMGGWYNGESGEWQPSSQSC